MLKRALLIMILGLSFLAATRSPAPNPVPDCFPCDDNSGTGSGGN
jgi:hypothetical protein